MQTLHTLVDLFLHLDKHLGGIIEQYQTWTYAILFLVVFCETGLVVTPFLPGDSLLFAAGVLAEKGGLNIHVVAVSLFIAAVLGDATNYAIGRFLGPKAFQEGDPGFLRRHFLKMEYLDRTERFYEKYGNKTIVLARFVPIVRTFAPFLAGIGKMSYPKFALYNIVGGAFWVGLLVYGGHYFSDLPLVRDNFSYVVLAIIAISVLPIAIELLKARKGKLPASTSNN